MRHYAAAFALTVLACGSEPTSEPVVRYRFDPAAAPASADDTIGMFERRAQRTPLDLAELADLYMKRGEPADLTKAEQLARQSIALLPSPNAAHLTLAKLANTRHDFRGAIAHAHDYLRTGDSPSAFLALATAHLALGELALACDAAEIAVDARPGTSSYLMRALVLDAQGRDAEAEHDFQRAVAVEDFGDVDESARLRALWARSLIRRGELPLADKAIAEALRIMPELPLALGQQGELALRRGNAKAAIALFGRAFAQGREVRYLIDTARAQDLAGDGAAARGTRDQIELLVRAELRDTGMGHRLDLVETLVDRGTPADLREAVTLARQEVALRPSAETLFQLARALARSGTHHEAALAIRRALATGVRSARFYELAARLERKTGNTQRAAMYAKEAARLDASNHGWRQLGMP